MSSAARWEHFDHGADIGIRGHGASPAAAFAQAAIAMTAVITDPALVQPRVPVTVECSATSLDGLLFAWIDALVYEMSTRRMLFSRFDVRLEGPRLHALLWGEPVDRQRHAPAVEIKGPTYTELKVDRDRRTGLWFAQCVVDV